jgi:hypothetical protein
MMRLIRNLAPIIVLLVVGCGDEDPSTSGGPGGGSSGTDATGAGTGGTGTSTATGTGGGGGACPDTMPSDGDACVFEGIECNYDACCPAGATCTDGKWQTWASGCALQECTATPPANGDSCACFASPSCSWNQCAGDGTIVTATCGAGVVWAVVTEPCAPLPCGPEGLECDPGDVCVSHTGGPGISYGCAPNPCVGAPLTCDCAGPTLCGSDSCSVVSAQELACVCSDCA